MRYSLYVMTIKGQDIPEKINIGYLQKETRPYIPNLKDASNAKNLDTPKIHAKEKAVCAGCGEEGHNVDDCQNDPECVNCEGDHRAISKDCPIWKQEKDIVTLKNKENISFADASIQKFLCICNANTSTITKSHILSPGPPTTCHDCGQTLTIDHMLLECAVLQECRDEYYRADSLNTLFETIPETFIVEFL